MTVGIAAICQNPIPNGAPEKDQFVIVGAADRMISTPDTQYESDQMKIFGFMPAKAVGIVAGNASYLVPVCEAVHKTVTPQTTVEDLAWAVSDEHARYRNRLSETAFLRPIGLDNDKFLRIQQEMDEKEVADIRKKMTDFDLGTEMIIAGTDDTGPHLYHIDGCSGVRCDDLTGMTVVGSGYWHASSHMMLARHSRFMPFHRTLLQTYIAKRKSESAPGIGRTTDLFAITNVNGVMYLFAELQDKMKDLVDKMELDMAPIALEAETATGAFLTEIMNRAPAAPASAQPKPPAGEKDGEWGGSTWSGPTGPTGPSTTSPSTGPSLKVVP